MRCRQLLYAAGAAGWRPAELWVGPRPQLAANKRVAGGLQMRATCRSLHQFVLSANWPPAPRSALPAAAHPCRRPPHATMRCFLLFAALAALLACASANNHVCNSGWQDRIEPSANGQTYGNPHGEPRRCRRPLGVPCHLARTRMNHREQHLSPALPSTPPTLAADAMFISAMTAGVASKGCGLLAATKYEACYSSGAFLRSRRVAGEWGFGGQLTVFCPNKNKPEKWNALAIANVTGSKWELTGEPTTSPGLLRGWAGLAGCASSAAVAAMHCHCQLGSAFGKTCTCHTRGWLGLFCKPPSHLPPSLPASQPPLIALPPHVRFPLADFEATPVRA